MAKAKGSQDKKPRYREVNYDGNKYRIAVVEKGKDISIEEKIKIAELVCEMYKTDEYTLADCLGHCGIKGKATWYSWMVEIEPIKLLYQQSQRAKDLQYRHELKNRARTMAEKLVEGYTMEVKEREAQPGFDDKGKPILKTTKVKTKTVFVKPSAAVVLKVLYNMDAVNFQEHPKPDEKINEEVNIPPISWVDNEADDE